MCILEVMTHYFSILEPPALPTTTTSSPFTSALEAINAVSNAVDALAAIQSRSAEPRGSV